MKVLIVHNEIEHYAGAERMLEYFARSSTESSDLEISVACAPNERLTSNLDKTHTRFTRYHQTNPALPEVSLLRSEACSPLALQAKPDIIHAWHARAWELAAVVGFMKRIPVTGILHDHPAAPFISSKRSALMRFTANRGMRRLICVSEAVRTACLNAGYRNEQTITVHNGLPLNPRLEHQTGNAPDRPLRVGFLGAFSERKGLDLFFSVIDEVASELDEVSVLIGGDAASEEGRTLVRELKAKYEERSWWRKVEWLGWVSNTESFFESIDLLLFTSKDFDPLPTVIIEAGMAGVPVVASRVGGVEEMIVDGETGHVFDPDSPSDAARDIVQLATQPAMVAKVGSKHRDRISTHFNSRRMLESYAKIWNDLLSRKQT